MLYLDPFQDGFVFYSYFYILDIQRRVVQRLDNAKMDKLSSSELIAIPWIVWFLLSLIHWLAIYPVHSNLSDGQRLIHCKALSSFQTTVASGPSPKLALKIQSNTYILSMMFTVEFIKTLVIFYGRPGNQVVSTQELFFTPQTQPCSWLGRLNLLSFVGTQDLGMLVQDSLRCIVMSETVFLQKLKTHFGHCKSNQN